GAGAAGLAAARVLSRRGTPADIFEARQRPGGRIFTVHDPLSPVPIELGAEFLHGMPPEVWPAVESGRLPAVEISGDHRLFEDGRLVANGGADIDQLLAGSSGEASFEQFIQRQRMTAAERTRATRYVEGFHAARPRDASLAALRLTTQAE